MLSIARWLARLRLEPIRAKMIASTGAVNTMRQLGFALGIAVLGAIAQAQIGSRLGAEGVVHALVERGAIGLISTHDLSLTEISGALNGHLHNVHFQDEIEKGTMKFDYKLRDGIVTKSNGLELMRLIGLEV